MRSRPDAKSQRDKCTLSPTFSGKKAHPIADRSPLGVMLDALGRVHKKCCDIRDFSLAAWA